MDFQEEYEKLRTQEKNQFSDVLNNLLFHCYIVEKRFDRATGMDKFQWEYSFIERHFSLFEAYLDIMGITLSKDQDAGVFFIRSQDDRNTVRFNTPTTMVVFALRSYYEGQLEQRPNMLSVKMDANLLRQTLNDFGLSSVTKRLTADQIGSALKTLQSFNIVVLAAGSFSDPTYAFYILPSIRFIIDRDRMNSLYRFITGEEASSDSAAEEEPAVSQPSAPVEKKVEGNATPAGDAPAAPKDEPSGF